MSEHIASLLTRLASPEPDDRLNEDVARALGWRQNGQYWQSPEMAARRFWQFGPPPDFLNDVNAALAEVPEGWRVEHMGQTGSKRANEAWYADLRKSWDGTVGLVSVGRLGATLARAIICAVLKAKQG